LAAVTTTSSIKLAFDAMEHMTLVAAITARLQG